MLSVKKLNRLLKKVTYKPGWRFKVYEGRCEGQHITIKARLIDAYKPKRMLTIGVESALPPMHTREQFYEWLLWRLQRIESHECREFFQVNGKPYDDPHAEYADRDL